jgi:DNA-directed RNA polymerase subunit RPC12/RpoP
MSALGLRKQLIDLPAARLVCRSCRHERALTQEWVESVRSVLRGMEWPVVEDLQRLLHRFTCSQCGARNAEYVQGLREESGRASDSTLEKKSDESPLCAECGESVPSKRLQAMPGTPFCVTCQREFEKRLPEEEPDPCKKCGAKMVWRVRQSVLPTKYFLGCTNYPRCTFVVAGD